MDAKCKKHLEDVPILDGHCRVNLTSKLGTGSSISSISASSNEYFNFYTYLIPDDSTEHIEASRAGLDHWKSNKYYRVVQLMQSLLIVLVLCFAAFLIYLSVSGNAENIHQTSHPYKLKLLKNLQME